MVKDKVLVIRLTSEQLYKIDKLKRKKFDGYYHSPKENNSDVVRRLIDEAQIKKKQK